MLAGTGVPIELRDGGRSLQRRSGSPLKDVVQVCTSSRTRACRTGMPGGSPRSGGLEGRRAVKSAKSHDHTPKDDAQAHRNASTSFERSRSTSRSRKRLRGGIRVTLAT